MPCNPFTAQLENLYGFLALVGVITLAIIGMLYKIVPFLVWFARYSRQIGRKKVPALSDLYSARLQALGYWSYLAGLTVASIGIVGASENIVRAGCILFAASVGSLVANLALMLLHLFRPKTEPLPFQTAPAPKPL